MRIRALIGTFSAFIIIGFTIPLAHSAGEVWDGRFYLVPAISFNFPDKDLKVDDDTGVKFAVGKPITHHLNLEFQGLYWESEDANATAELGGIGANLLLFPNRYRWPAYGLLGVASSRLELTKAGVSSNEDGTLYDIGFGFLQPFTGNGTSIRWEYRYRFNDAESDDFRDQEISLGLHIPLGEKPRRLEPVAAPKQIVKAPPKPAPAPELPKPVIVLQGVHFEFDSSVLTPKATTILSNTAVTLRELTDLSTIAIGHTCNIGEETYNDKLSLDRANSVRDFLMSRGIEGDRLKVKGYGESMPIADNATKEGRVLNRRVEISVISDAICLPPREGDETDANGCALIK